jgi:hypothetical protein
MTDGIASGGSMNKYEISGYVRVARTTLLQRSSTTFLTVAALLFLFSGQAVCHVLYGSLVGSVTDSTGAVLLGAEIQVRNLDTGVLLQATTNGAGNYVAGNLTAGRFEVTIKKDGLGSFKAPSVSIAMNNQARIDAALDIGGTTETVAVSANAAQLQTDRFVPMRSISRTRHTSQIQEILKRNVSSVEYGKDSAGNRTTQILST